MNVIKCARGLAIFASGVLFGSAGFKVLGSKDARKVYTHTTAAALRCKESVMTSMTTIQEAAEDILADAKEINEARAKAEAEEIVEDTAE